MNKLNIIVLVISIIIVILIIIIITLLTLIYNNLLTNKKKNKENKEENKEKFIMPNPREAIYINSLAERNLNLAKNAVNFNPNKDYTKPGDQIIVYGNPCGSILKGNKDNKIIYIDKDDILYSNPSTAYNTSAEITIGNLNRNMEEAIEKYNIDALILPNPEIKYIDKNYYNYYKTPNANSLLGLLQPEIYKPLHTIFFGIRDSINISNLTGLVLKNNDRTKLIDHVEIINNKFTYIPKKVEESGNWTRYSLGNITGDNIYSIRFIDSNGDDVYKCNDDLIWAIY